MKKWILICSALFSATCMAKEANTLFTVHRAELNQQNKPKMRTLSEKGGRFQIENMADKSVRTIHMNKKVKGVYLEAGNYCYSSVFISQSQRAPFLNPICFTISNEHVNIIGTFVIGTRITTKGAYSLILDIKQNYEEIAKAANQPNAKPVPLFKPKD
ncbi:hypothetical protein [Pseudoalteromonas luteoviolacea]|uniref:DUF4468 domain-containing protein n=1 Tax=Pseudoalteromonas luteoviolacea S4060-1 TaxID=1365257 RepID=A0A167NTX4_9GAMM|nr:hypothetical protein [Pseudoalteromonas luteoviolacea]KZN28503.1 hypothetical protein N480_10440 [Pseudoalteromonas luteoviolacea S2607]KZN68779.1 hypothetical protein N478_14035 [Pseudoalteromonas luteoviolacea S4060-1]